MKILLIHFTLLFLINQIVFTQQTRPSSFPIIIFDCHRDTIPIIHEWLGCYRSRILTHDMRLVYQVPKGFKEVRLLDGSECFRGNRLLRRLFFCVSSPLQSENDESVSFFGIHSIDTKRLDSVHSYRMRFIYNSFYHYLQYIQGLVSDSQWFLPNSDVRSSGFYVDWRESAFFFSSEETRTKFNADTAAFFTLTLPPEYYFQERFRYVDVFLLQKMGRGYVYFISFYTEKAKRNIDWYRRRLWGSLRYED